MAYQMNIFLVLARTLMDTPEVIMRTRRSANMEREDQIERIKQTLPDQDPVKLKRLEELVAGMKKEYSLYEHYVNAAPTPLPQNVLDGLKPSVTRLIVVAHGDENDPRWVEMDDGDPKKVNRISAQLLASWVRTFLSGRKIERISLHVCSAAKLHEPPANSIKTAESFALSFARSAGDLAESISARTGSVTTESPGGNRVTSETAKGIHKYRQSDHKKTYSTGKTAAQRPSDYGEKNARDQLVSDLFEGFNSQLQKKFAAEEAAKLLN